MSDSANIDPRLEKACALVGQLEAGNQPEADNILEGLVAPGVDHGDVMTVQDDGDDQLSSFGC